MKPDRSADILFLEYMLAFLLFGFALSMAILRLVGRL